MKQVQRFVVLSVLAGGAFGISAQERPQQTTKVMFRETVRLPGAKLTAGTYEIRILDRLPDRYILEVAKPSGDALATFLAVPDDKFPQRAPGKPVFWAKKETVPTVRGMWLHGANAGAAFVFPKADAAALAKQVGQPVPAVDPDSEGKRPVAAMSGSDRKIVTLWLLSAVAVTPEGEKTGIQAAKYVPAVTPGKAGQLPSTAGNFSLYLSAGLAAVSSGLFLLRLARST